eukprot:s3891_g10.t1
MFVQDSDDEDNVEVKRDNFLRSGLVTIHHASQGGDLPQPDDSMPVPSFALAKPVETGPATEDSQVDQESFGDNAENFDFQESAQFVEDGNFVESPPEPDKSQEVEVESPKTEAGDKDVEMKAGDKNVEEKTPEKEKKNALKQKLLKDPKFKKGTKMSSLSPKSQEALKLVRKARAIENSNKWHAKWSAKGVPKEGEDQCDSSSKSASSAVPGPAEHPEPESIQESADSEAANPPSSNAADGKPMTLNDMRARFIGNYTKETKGTPECNLKLANKAWMESEERAKILAARKGKVPT